MSTVAGNISAYEVVRRAQEAIEAAETYRGVETYWFGVVDDGSPGGVFRAVDINTGSTWQRPPRGGDPRDIVAAYINYASNTIFHKFANGSFEARTYPKPPERDPLVEFLDTRGADWTLLGTESIEDEQAYVIHRILPGQAFEGFDLLETLWIDPDSFLPLKRELTSNDAGMPFLAETVYFAFGAPVDVSVPQQALESLAVMLPAANEIPAGLSLTEVGTRTAEEITQTFPDPVDAAERFAEWGWQENAFRIFAKQDGSLSIEVSAHRFGSEVAAASALPYFAEARGTLLGLHEIFVEPLGDQTQAIGGPAGERIEVTLYIRRGAVVTRVTALSLGGDPIASAVAMAEATASAVATAEAFLAK